MKSLYDYNNEILAAIQMFEAGISEVVDTETGEIKDIKAYMDELEAGKDEKIKNIALYIKDMSLYVDGLKAEKARIDEKKKAAENTIERLKRYLMDATEGKKYTDPQFSISYRKSEAVEIEEGANIPDEYLIQQEPKISKTELKKAIKAGATFDGIQLVERKNMILK